MKKLFAIAMAAMSMIMGSCSNETTEILEEGASDVTRAQLHFNLSEGWSCTLLENCSLVQDVREGNIPGFIVGAVNALANIDHCHCTAEDCEYYNGYTFTNWRNYDWNGQTVTGYEWMQLHAREANANTHNGGHGAIN